MFLTIVSVILILSILVIVHEFGHYITALKFGMKVEEFAVGMGPIIFKFTSKKTNIIYSIRCIPIGGFCKIKGEDGEQNQETKNRNQESEEINKPEPKTLDSDSFGAKKIWQRAIVLIGGVFMNFIFALFFIYIGFLVGMPDIINEKKDYSTAEILNPKIQIVTLLENSNATKSGLKSGDEILKINDKIFQKVSEIDAYLATQDQVNFIIRDLKGVEKDILVKKEYVKELDKNLFGLSFEKTGVIKYSAINAIPETFKLVFSFIGQMLFALGVLISSIFSGNGIPDGLAGPVGIAVITGEVVKLGISYILQFVAVLSLNLAIVNILPFPALDGGRLLFLFFEKLKGKPLNQKFELIANSIGFLILMALIAFVTFKDIGTFILK